MARFFRVVAVNRPEQQRKGHLQQSPAKDQKCGIHCAAHRCRAAGGEDYKGDQRVQSQIARPRTDGNQHPGR